MYWTKPTWYPTKPCASCGKPATRELAVVLPSYTGVYSVMSSTFLCDTCTGGSTQPTQFFKASSFPPKVAQWFKTPDGDVVLGCPLCNSLVTITAASPQVVHGDGAVSPSVVCPSQGCRFHAFVKLEGWA